MTLLLRGSLDTVAERVCEVALFDGPCEAAAALFYRPLRSCRDPPRRTLRSIWAGFLMLFVLFEQTQSVSCTLCVHALHRKRYCMFMPWSKYLSVLIQAWTHTVCMNTLYLSVLVFMHAVLMPFWAKQFAIWYRFWCHTSETVGWMPFALNSFIELLRFSFNKCVVVIK